MGFKVQRPIDALGIESRISKILADGLEKTNAHPRAVELATEPFFWNGGDDLAPFGSDDGHTALCEYLEWRKTHTDASLRTCMRWVIESVGEMKFRDYNESLVNRERITEQLADPNFDDRQFLWTLDVSVIATAFAKLVLEGVIDAGVKDLVQIALNRQRLFAEICRERWSHADRYIDNLGVLTRVLSAAVAGA